MGDEIEKILREVTEDYWEHMTCSEECGKKTMCEDNLKSYVDKIIALFSAKDKELVEKVEKTLSKAEKDYETTFNNKQWFEGRIDGIKEALDDVLSLLKGKNENDNN